MVKSITNYELKNKNHAIYKTVYSYHLQFIGWGDGERAK
jgi:hypothetical protein